jgi:hypothetical protein
MAESSVAMGISNTGFRSRGLLAAVQNSHNLKASPKRSTICLLGVAAAERWVLHGPARILRKATSSVPLPLFSIRSSGVSLQARRIRKPRISVFP